MNYVFISFSTSALDQRMNFSEESGVNCLTAKLTLSITVERVAAIVLIPFLVVQSF
jgi:hypothetical protein